VQWVSRDGRVLHGWLGGAETGPLVAVLHGTPDTRHVAMTGDDAARSIGVRLLCVNRPGYGDSEPHETSHEGVADHLVDVARQLGEERLGLVGMSVGGDFALGTAARHPQHVAALALVATQLPGDRVEPVGTLVEEFRAEYAEWCAGVRPEDPDDEALVARWLPQLPGADAELVSELGVAAVAASVREALGSPEGYLRDAALHSRPWPFDPGEVRCPAYLWLGRQDNRSDPALIDRALAALDLRAVHRPDTTHLATLLTSWDEVFAALKSHLA
jgi:pimeloyl-ACP methyl ester carboxylesterase